MQPFFARLPSPLSEELKCPALGSEWSSFFPLQAFSGVRYQAHFSVTSHSGNSELQPIYMRLLEELHRPPPSTLRCKLGGSGIQPEFRTSLAVTSVSVVCGPKRSIVSAAVSPLLIRKGDEMPYTSVEQVGLFVLYDEGCGCGSVVGQHFGNVKTSKLQLKRSYISLSLRIEICVEFPV